MFVKITFFSISQLLGDTEDGGPLSPEQGETINSGEISENYRLESLKKQLAVENKVKQGAENMLKMYNSVPSKQRDRKLIAEAQQLLEDSKTKMEIIRMAILREQQQSSTPGRDGSSSGKENTAPVGLSSCELRVEDIRHHIEIESRVIEGAKKIIKHLQKNAQDKQLLEVSVRVLQFIFKIQAVSCLQVRPYGNASLSDLSSWPGITAH